MASQSSVAQLAQVQSVLEPRLLQTIATRGRCGVERRPEQITHRAARIDVAGTTGKDVDMSETSESSGFID